MVASVQNPALSTLALQSPSAARADGRPAARGGEAQPNSSAAQDAAPTTAALAAVRDGLVKALGALDLALSGGRGALDALRDNRADPPGAASAYAAVIDEAIGSGALLLRGDVLRVALSPGADPFEIQGEDLRLPSRFQTTPEGVDGLLQRLEDALSRFGGAAKRLDTHASLLGTLDQAIAAEVQPDLGADGARLAALQVSQSLSERGGGLGAGASQTILSLFRA